jgi:5-methylcytosine-specific restriction endonuclease McrA
VQHADTYFKEYYLAHRDEIIARSIQWNKSHPEQRRVTCKRWRENNPTYRSEWRHDNPDRELAYKHNRRAKESNGGTYSREELNGLFILQNYHCYYCDKFLTEYHIDHKIPVSRGGSNDISNIALACPRCNQSKNNKTDTEFLALRM